ncbi:MAG: hypothetical protein IJQ00_07535 [Kiritimatiellae bacterium]|nr:hypothetical protein [Kiritimatiellia bacterium]
MKRLIPLAVAVALLASGCTTVLKSKEFGSVKVDGGTTPVAAVEIENSVWLLFNFIPVASGSPDHPNSYRCKLFRNTVNLPNNMEVLRAEMAREGVSEVVNLTSHYADEKYLFFLLARRACHTSAVLIQSGAKDKEPAKK